VLGNGLSPPGYVTAWPLEVNIGCHGGRKITLVFQLSAVVIASSIVVMLTLCQASAEPLSSFVQTAKTVSTEAA
jgi:hypothetical protein